MTKQREKYFKYKLEKKEKMKLDRTAMYGIARRTISRSDLEKLTTIDGYAAIHQAGDQPLEFLRLVRNTVFRRTGNMRHIDMLAEIFNILHDFHQGDRMEDTEYFRLCNAKYDAPVSADHPNRPALDMACRLKSKLLNLRRHS